MHVAGMAQVPERRVKFIAKTGDSPKLDDTVKAEHLRALHPSTDVLRNEMNSTVFCTQVIGGEKVFGFPYMTKCAMEDAYVLVRIKLSVKKISDITFDCLDSEKMLDMPATRAELPLGSGGIIQTCGRVRAEALGALRRSGKERDSATRALICEPQGRGTVAWSRLCRQRPCGYVGLEAGISCRPAS